MKTTFNLKDNLSFPQRRKRSGNSNEVMILYCQRLTKLQIILPVRWVSAYRYRCAERL